MANRAGLREGLAWEDGLRQHQWGIAHYETAPDSCIGLWFPISDKQANLENAAYLKRQHLAIFATTTR